MSTIELTGRISLSTDRAESGYGIPVLVVDGQSFGPSDVYGPAVRATLTDESDPLNWLVGQYSGYQHLLSLATTADQKAALDKFCPARWEMKVGE